jgi:hypothetical protein
VTGHPAAKERILRASGDDTVRSSVFDISRRLAWPVPFTGRALRNAHADYWLGREIDLLQQIEVEAARYAAAREAGDFDIAVVHAGEAVYLINDMPPRGDHRRARGLRSGAPAWCGTGNNCAAKSSNRGHLKPQRRAIRNRRVRYLDMGRA